MKKNKLLIISGIVSMLLLFAFVLSNGSENIAVFDIPTTLPEAALYPVDSIKCSMYLKTDIVDSKGRIITTDRSSIFSGNPNVTYELVATTSGNPVSSVKMSLWSNCKSAVDAVFLGSGTVSASVYGKKSSTSPESLFAQKSFTTNQYSWVKNSAGYNQIGSVTFSHDDLDNKITSDKDYKVNFNFQMKGVKLFDVWYAKYPTVKYQFKLESGKLITYYSADYKTKLTAPSTVKDTDNDGIQDTFDKCITQKETVNGYLDNDGCPDTAPSPSPSPSPTPSPSPSPTPTTEQPKKATIYLKYKMVLENEILQNDITKTGGINIEFKPFSLVSVKDKRFLSIMIEPIMKLAESSSDFSSTVGGLKYGAQVQYGTNAYDLKNFVGSTNNRIVKDSSGYYRLPPFEITSDMIKKTFETIPDANQNSPNPFKLRIAITGDFDLTRQSDNKKFKTVLNDIGMFVDMSYDPSMDIDPSEPCQGLNGEALLECKAQLCYDTGECLPPSSKGGTCEDVQTSLECVDGGTGGSGGCNDVFGLLSCGTTSTKTGNTGGGSKTTTDDTPKTNPSDITLCPEGQTLGECLLNSVPNQSDSGLPIDQNTIVIILVIFLIIIVIVIIVKRRK